MAATAPATGVRATEAVAPGRSVLIGRMSAAKQVESAGVLRATAPVGGGTAGVAAIPARTQIAERGSTTHGVARIREGHAGAVAIAITDRIRESGAVVWVRGHQLHRLSAAEVLRPAIERLRAADR